MRAWADPCRVSDPPPTPTTAVDGPKGSCDRLSFFFPSETRRTLHRQQQEGILFFLLKYICIYMKKEAYREQSMPQKSLVFIFSMVCFTLRRAKQARERESLQVHRRLKKMVGGFLIPVFHMCVRATHQMACALS